MIKWLSALTVPILSPPLLVQTEPAPVTTTVLLVVLAESMADRKALELKTTPPLEMTSWLPAPW